MDSPADRARLVEELEDWRLSYNAHWALTLSLGVSPRGHFDPEASLRPQRNKLLKNISSEVFGVPRRQIKHLTIETAPFFAGLYESHDKHRNPWPHIHGCFALGGQSEALLRGVLRDRWGEDAHPEKPGIIARDLAAVPSPSRDLAPRGVVNRLDYRPSFALEPIFSAKWLGGYASKLSSVRDVSVWTTAEIMKLAA
ncbi:MAG: hypothetical protein ACOH1H_01335 [Brevundimonas sp.]